MLRPYRGRVPAVHETAYVDASAQVIGRVTIGAESSVWMNAVIRGDVNDIRIGARTNVQDGAVVHVMHETHPTRIGDDVTIGHAAVVHGCTVGNRVLIGMGAVLLNGATIGDDSLVAAGSLVTEGQAVPAGSLVMGVPATVRRSLTDEETHRVLESAANYVRYRLDYAT
jgi:carbonic anhydrase/acetyltransferase-like protein (isoleucine patch superfamily)